jgi:hypothetical protein
MVGGLSLAADFLAAVAWDNDRQLVEAFEWVRLMRQELAVLAITSS